MTAGAGRTVAQLAAELDRHGPSLLNGLPDPDDLAAREEGARLQVLEGLRVQLYAIASLLADATVRRAITARSSFPPYGLVRSMYSESRMVLATPDPVGQGAVGDFKHLGKAYIDTMVFHLDREMSERRAEDGAWMLRRLEGLLTLFRLPAGPATKARMRDGFSFMYGGLHFGTSTCTQLVEAMSRLLDIQAPDLGVDRKVDVLTRSIRPAYRLAAVNVDHVVTAYQALQSPPWSSRAGWMDTERFVLRRSAGGTGRIDLSDEETLGGRPHGRRFDDIPATYSTHGCPARNAPLGGSSAIATLWTWCVELARDTGLLVHPARPV